IMIPVPYIVNQILKLGSKIFGMVQGSLPIGAIVGAVFVNRKKTVLTEKVFMKIFGVFLISCAILYCTSFNLEKTGVADPCGLALAMFISGMAFGILDVTAATYFQENVPEDIRGKIMGLITGIVKFTMPLAFIISGKITDRYSPFMSIGLGGSIILAALFFLTVISYARKKEGDKISEIA
ncbi:MAG: MFS transporter, partial [Fusobacteriaceae bacterium]